MLPIRLAVNGQDNLPASRSHYRVIYAGAIALHLTWAGALATAGADSMRTTALAWSIGLFDTRGAAVLYGLIGLGALAAITLRLNPWVSLVLLLPQQFVLLVSGGTALTFMAAGAFADGVIRPHAFIIADQAPSVILTMMHSLALILGYRPRWG